MDFLNSMTTGISNFWNNSFGSWGNTNSNDITIKQPTASVQMVSQQLPTRRPEVIPQPTQSSGVLTTFGSIFKDVAGIAENTINTVYTTKQKIAEAKLANEMTDLKMQAIRQSVQSAPQTIQQTLPSYTDWLEDPNTAMSRVTPSAIFGSGAVQSGASVMTIGIIGLTLFLLVRK